MSLGTENGLSVADIAAVTDRNNGNGFGGGFLGEWLIAIIMMFMFPMMYGGFGGGMWGGMGGWGNGGMIAAANGALTRADLCSEFNFNGLENAVRGVTQGLCDGFYAMQNSINGLGMNVMQGFSQAELSRCNQQAALMQQLYQMGYNQQDCCCQTQRAIEGVNYNLATQGCDTRNTIQNSTRDIIDSQNSGFRAILDKMCQQEIAAKDAQIAAQNQRIFALELSASQADQSAVLRAAMEANKADILRRTGNDCPVSAVVVQPPTPVSFPTNCCGTFSGWGNTACGTC
ncbi:MAG: hypothetical protein HFE93_04865 [Acutalibacter muris]|jgi:hypothetical protein|uniref:hypothetical protein n=1 Tax=Acutalibacter muris TaxID=1796620 RepID=UPI00272E9466|nr:hypothetical protein [Acutalibacter muris]MCI9193223.1 hypothetical protein [Acutalibacter muris]MCI9543513.1 hypothetical protein [Acutalibacter muris]